MILTPEDLNEFEAHWRDEQRYGWKNYDFLAWVGNNPQVMMAGAGYQEFIGAYRSPLFRALAEWGIFEDIYVRDEIPLFREYIGRWLALTHTGETTKQRWEGHVLDATYFAAKRVFKESGASTYESLDSRSLADIRDAGLTLLPSFEEVLASASKYVEHPLLDSTLFISPKLWTPTNQKREKSFLQQASVNLINAINAEECELTDLTWKQFEEVVAEVLRAQGMEIHLVRESPQGGRDIIARTELVPGSEVLTIAVEVKHQRVVDRPQVQMAIQQNKQFPVLMFVTSGRFTAGVFSEAANPENRMRLWLRDGIAFRHLLSTYGLECA